MNSQTIQNDTNNSELNSVTLPYYSYTNSLSFSKLLENVIMAAKSKSNQGKSELSHQEPLANVTAKATQKGNSCCTDKSSGDVPRTPLSDGYSWRKYGQKKVKGSDTSESSRSYYRCSSLSCCAKKKVQYLDSSGEVIDVVYQGDHNHVPPEKLRGTSQKEESALCASQNSSDSFLQNLDASRSLASEGELKQLVPSTYESQDRNPNSADGTLRKDVTEKHSKIADSVSRPESEPARVPTLEEHSGTRSNNPNELAITDPMKVLAVAPSKKRRIEERGKASSELVYRTSKDPKVVVIADTKVGLSSDGYRWRKYGQKMVKGNPHPRSYYRCSSVGCPVRKHVERATDNPTTFVVTYEGKHEHDIPTPKCYHHLASPDAPVSDADIPTPKRHHQLASPNAMASDANTVLEKSENKSLSQLSAEEQSKDVDSNPVKDQKVSENGGDKVLESAQTLLSMGNELKSS